MRQATEQDIPKVNEILNAPDVIEGASMGTYISMDAGIVLDMGGTVLVNDTGGFLLIPTKPNEYEAHMFFLPEGRGKNAIRSAGEGLRIMFDGGAERITARIPLSNKASRLLTKRIGFESTGTGESDYGVGGIHETEFFKMEKYQCPRQL